MAISTHSERYADGKRLLDLLIAHPIARAEYERLQPREAVIRPVLAARVARGWSQADLARALGVSRPVVSRFESGDVDPRWSTIVRFYAALGIPLTAGTGKRASRLVG